MQDSKSKMVINELKNSYFQDARPWIVAYSGGKDSTVVLHLVLQMLLDIGDRSHKNTYVITSDTGVEPPNILNHIESTILAVQDFSNINKLSLKTITVRPNKNETFWVNLIGKGYPSPTRWFRWCTAKLKINPTKDIIKRITSSEGSVVLLLGTRIDESASRGRRMKNRDNNRIGRNPHNDIPDTLVATPIAEWTQDDVWKHLRTSSPPWGGGYDFLIDLYRQAKGGECPFVLDLSSPSCGGSRFGCWTCTVVKEDKSMRGFIDSGEEWLRPLNEIRDWLKIIREDDSRRMNIRRNGTPGPGPFTYNARTEIFDRILVAEKKLKRELITDEEIYTIQAFWNGEFDLKNKALEIASKHGRSITMPEHCASPRN